MGAHKGKKWKDKPAKIRYHSTGRRLKNKLARVIRCNGPVFAEVWRKRYGV